MKSRIFLFASLLCLLGTISPFTEDIWKDYLKLGSKNSKFVQKFVRLVDKKGNLDGSSKNISTGIVQLHQIVAIAPSEIVQQYDTRYPHLVIVDDQQNQEWRVMYMWKERHPLLSREYPNGVILFLYDHATFAEQIDKRLQLANNLLNALSDDNDDAENEVEKTKEQENKQEQLHDWDEIIEYLASEQKTEDTKTKNDREEDQNNEEFKDFKITMEPANMTLDELIEKWTQDKINNKPSVDGTVLFEYLKRIQEQDDQTNHDSEIQQHNEKSKQTVGSEESQYPNNANAKQSENEIEIDEYELDFNAHKKINGKAIVFENDHDFSVDLDDFKETGLFGDLNVIDDEDIEKMESLSSGEFALRLYLIGLGIKQHKHCQYCPFSSEFKQLLKSAKIFCNVS